MVKHTQTVRRQKPTNCLSVFDHFVRLAPKGLSSFVDVMESVLTREVLIGRMTYFL